MFVNTSESDERLGVPVAVNRPPPGDKELGQPLPTVPTPHGPLHVELERGKVRVRAPRGVEVDRRG